MRNSLTNIVSPIYRLIEDQLIGRSINQSTDQSINQSINQGIVSGLLNIFISVMRAAGTPYVLQTSYQDWIAVNQSTKFNTSPLTHKHQATSSLLIPMLCSQQTAKLSLSLLEALVHNQDFKKVSASAPASAK